MGCLQAGDTGTHRIEVPDSPQATQLLDELMAYEIRVTDSGSVVASARSGQHDDLVLALALCVLDDDAPSIRYSGPDIFSPPRLHPDTDDWTMLHSQSGW